MIADKVLPSIYSIELEGLAVRAIIGGEHDIERIDLASNEFPNDLAAMAGLKTALTFIVGSPELANHTMKEVVEFNPEFFPSLPAPELTEEQLERQELLADQLLDVEAELEPGQIAVPMTKTFDSLGDFVETRWLIEAPTFKIIGRVSVEPAEYMKFKTKEHELLNEPLPIHLPKPMVH